MSLRLILAVAVALLASQVQAQVAGGKRGEIKSLKDKASYSFGMTMGTRLKKQEVDIDIELLVQGLRDGVGGGKLLLTEEQAMEAMSAFEKAVTQKQTAENVQFLVDNKKRTGIKTTDNGLQYKVVKSGTGPRPRVTDTVSVVYRGTFINGEEFDSSGGKPFKIAVANVIEGWKEALQLMGVGSKWQLFVPAELAYGEQGFPPAIGPNATLIFDIELLAIEKPGAQTGAAGSAPKR
jgi:FKBP-type peptidyl-prolyl cis-trans isomerase FklB